MALREEADEIPVYARCSAGIGRWYWVAWDSQSDAQGDSPPRASGYEKSAAAAEKKAIESVGPEVKLLPAKWASGRMKGGGGATRTNTAETEVEGGSTIRAKAPVRRLGGTFKKGSGTPRLAFLYSAVEKDPPDLSGHAVVARHRIVKENARKIYIDRDPFDEEEWTRRGDEGIDSPESIPKGRTLTIDRDMLRREGRFRHRLSYREQFFYASEADGIRDVEATLTSKHAWCATLGVRFPCSAEDVKVAYRRLAKTAHPDVGGDATSFRTVERAYRDALAYFTHTDDSTALSTIK